MPLEDVEVTPLRPQRFAEVLTGEDYARFDQTIAAAHALLDQRTIWNVNSTAFGGGVAEMLRSLIGYVRGAGLDGRWVLAEGDPAFFSITKRLHNRLHGSPGDGGSLGAAERAVYERRCEVNAVALADQVRPGDVVILHDPQTAGMIPILKAVEVPLIWRAHIGLDLPNDLARETWSFLLPYVEQERGRAAKPGLQAGVCGEHGGDPSSIRFFHGAGVDYVSCSPFRVPVARVAAAQAVAAGGR